MYMTIVKKHLLPIYKDGILVNCVVIQILAIKFRELLLTTGPRAKFGGLTGFLGRLKIMVS